MVDNDGNFYLTSGQTVLATDFVKVTSGKLVKVTQSFDPGVVGQVHGALTATADTKLTFKKGGWSEGVALVQDPAVTTNPFNSSIAVGDLLSLVYISSVQYLVKSDLLPVAIAREALDGVSSATTTGTIDIELICPPVPKIGFVQHTAGEAITAYQCVYLKAADGKVYKSVNTTDATSQCIGFAAHDAASSAAVGIIKFGRYKAIAGGTIAIGDLLTPSATAGRVTTHAGTHNHNITVATEAYPGGVALNYNVAGTAGTNRLAATAGGTDATTNFSAYGKVCAVAEAAATAGLGFNINICRMLL